MRDAEAAQMESGVGCRVSGVGDISSSLRLPAPDSRLPALSHQTEVASSFGQPAMGANGSLALPRRTPAVVASQTLFAASIDSALIGAFGSATAPKRWPSKGARPPS